MPADLVDAVVAAFRAEGMKGDDELVERFARVAVETCERDTVRLDPGNVELRLIVARAVAETHGAPLGFHDEEDQLGFDRAAQSVLRALAEFEIGERDG